MTRLVLGALSQFDRLQVWDRKSNYVNMRQWSLDASFAGLPTAEANEVACRQPKPLWKAKPGTPYNFRKVGISSGFHIWIEWKFRKFRFLPAVV